MSKLTFNIDKKQVAEGEYINVTWDCSNPDMVSLTVEDGIKSIHQLSDSGSRSIPASGNADKIILTLRASIDFSKIKTWWNGLASKLKLAWTYMPENKKLAYKILGLIMVAMILTSISPKLATLGFLLVVGYLFWVIIKK